jgi:hypothetical protein
MEHGDTLAQRLLSGRSRVLEPGDRFGEVIFALIMVLTFTGSISVATSGRQEIREILIGALGCNLAWGIVDGVMFIVSSLGYRARQARIRHVVPTVAPAVARELVRTELPEVVDAALDDAAVDQVAAHIGRMREGPEPGLTRNDLLGALGVFLIVTLSTLPVVVPFLLVEEVHRALRLSNGIALAMLFVAGASFGKASGLRPRLVGIAITILGAVLVAVTMARGG